MSKPLPRLLLLPGWGEDARIFRNLQPELARHFSQVVNVTYREVLLGLPARPKPEAFLDRLIAFYGIEPGDVVIGHSFGGWVAYQLNGRVGCPAAMLCSLSERWRVRPTLKLFMPVSWVIRLGLFHTSFFRGYQRLRYRGKPSANEMEVVIQNFRQWTNTEIYQVPALMMQRIRKHEATNLLRIHAQQDELIRPPRELHVVVPGDHFAPATHPEPILQRLEVWLGGL
jgi:pimeloyl-ACP methyl ester carboxylesterase